MIKDKSIEAGIVMDEFEIRKGLVYLKNTGRLVGLLEEIKEKDVMNLNNNQIEYREANHILQFFLISNCGQISLPIGFVPTTVIKVLILYFLILI